MNIDFHHTVVYILARLADYSQNEADIIAYSSQYVDDSTDFGFIKFKNDALYFRVSSAHKTIDLRNFEDRLDHRVWLPFHFLPGNDNKPAGTDPGGKFINKLICRPNSPVAQKMVEHCFHDIDKPYALHRLGITLHTFADTWAHQGFAGVINDVNDVRDIESLKVPWYRRLINQIANLLIGDMLPLGHGALLTKPDEPYLVFDYYDHNKNRVTRDNPDQFIQAANEIYKVLVKFRKKSYSANVQGLDQKIKEQLLGLFKSIDNEDAEKRHKKWLSLIKEDAFSFGPEEISYKSFGKGSWKYEAIGSKEEYDSPGKKFDYKPEFLNSNWKLFHDALIQHRFTVLNDVLPQFGICAG